MKNRMKKLLGMSLAMAMTVSALAGCGNQNEQQTGKESETKVESSEIEKSSEIQTVESQPVEEKKFDDVVLNCLLIGADGIAMASRLEKINTILSDELGVTIEVEFAKSDTYDLQLASGEKYDIVSAGASYNYTTNAQKGAYYEITDEMLEEYGQDLLAEDAGIVEYTKVAGVRYAIGSVRPADYGVIAYRGDLAEKYGLGELKTMDDLEKYLLAIAENEKEMIAFDLNGSSSYILASLFMPQLGWSTPGGNNGNYYYADVETGEVFIAAEQLEYMEFITKMKNWYDSGVFSKSVLSNTGRINDSFNAGRSGVAYCSNLSTANAMWKEHQGDARKDWDVKFMPTSSAVKYRGGVRTTMASIGALSENPEASLAVINEVYSNEELHNLVYYGEEGVNYELDADGCVTMIEKGDEGWMLMVINEDYVFPTKYEFPTYEALKEYYEAIEAWPPVVSTSIANTAEMETAATALKEVKSMYTVPNIYGAFEGTPEEALAAELKALKAAGIDTYLEGVQAQINEAIGK